MAGGQALEAALETRFKLLGHPVHPMLIVYPLGLRVGVDDDAGLDASSSLGRDGVVDVRAR